MDTGFSRRHFLQLGAAGAAAAVLARVQLRRRQARQRPAVDAADCGPAGTGQRQADRHRPRGHPLPGEPVVRPVLRHPPRGTRLRRPRRADRSERQAGLVPADHGAPGRLRPAVPPRLRPPAGPVRARRRPRLGGPARGAGQRGHMDGFVRHMGAAPIGYFDPADLPYYRAWPTSSPSATTITARCWGRPTPTATTP